MAGTTAAAEGAKRERPQIDVTSHPLGEEYISQALRTPLSVVVSAHREALQTMSEGRAIVSRMSEDNASLVQAIDDAKEQVANPDEIEDTQRQYGGRIMFLGEDNLPQVSGFQFRDYTRSLILQHPENKRQAAEEAVAGEHPVLPDKPLRVLLEEQRQIFSDIEASLPKYHEVLDSTQSFHLERKQVVQDEMLNLLETLPGLAANV